MLEKLLIIISFYSCVFSAYSQQIIYQDICNCGVTGAGFSAGTGTGTGSFDIYMDPGSTIKKAYAFSYKIGFPPPETFILNGTPVIFDTNNVLMNVTHSNPNASPIFLNYQDITTFLNTSNINNSISLPQQLNLPINWGYWSFFVYVIYENQSFNATSFSILVNDKNLIGNESYNVTDLNPINITYPVGLSLYTDRTGGVSSSIPTPNTNIYFNGNSLGVIGGSDNNSISYNYAGVKGHFYYQNNQLFGLDDDTPDAIMNGSDALADVSSYLSNNATNCNFQLTHIEYPNQLVYSTNINLAYFLAYTSPCDTFTVTTPKDTTLCYGETLQLQASTTNPNATYEWQPSTGLSCSTCPNPIFTADSSMFYTVRIWNNDSCSVVRPLIINVRPQPQINTVISTPSECGANTGTVTLTAHPNNGIVANWQEQGGSSQASNTFSNLSTGNHSFFYIDTNGCTSADTSIFINEINTTLASFTANPLSGAAPLQVTFTNTSQNATNYEWFVDGLSQGSSLLTYLFENSGEYQIMLTAWQNSITCADTAYQTIYVYDSLVITIPNIFTPNNDAVNDIFTITANQDANFELVIINRWGNTLLELNNSFQAGTPHNCWNGANAMDGVYFFKLKVTDNLGKEFKLEGFLTLVK